jgi:hypothetical protein
MPVRERPVVITAAHCLRRGGEAYLPPPQPASYTEERTYADILGPLGGELGVWAECLFADPVADIAVLATPDTQELSEQADAYDRLVGGVEPFQVADRPGEGVGYAHIGDGQWIAVPEAGRGPAWVLSLGGEWVACTAVRRGHWLAVEPLGVIVFGMSGSPIITPAGEAVGVISTGSMNAVLAAALPRHGSVCVSLDPEEHMPWPPAIYLVCARC